MFKNLFGKEEVNLSRQFEFDMAKAVCILGMVLVHCFESIAAPSAEDGTAYYIMVIVLDCIFGAGTFMLCMGLGIAYSWKENASKLIKRGAAIFVIGYVLNILRDCIPESILTLMGKSEWAEVLRVFLCNDILPFAGLALMLFGILKKLKLSDLALFLVSLGMSVVGSLVRFVDLGNTPVNQIAGLFIGTLDEVMPDEMSVFPLLNWFIVVVIGYLYAKAIRRCKNIGAYYAVSFPVSAVILGIYLLVCIPRELGMMNSSMLYYYQFSTPNVLILFLGAVFATGAYHYISLLFSEKVKKVITRMSSNINSVYCIHWVMIGWLRFFINANDLPLLGDAAVFAAGLLIFVLANVLAEFYVRKIKHKQA